MRRIYTRKPKPWGDKPPNQLYWLMEKWQMTGAQIAQLAGTSRAHIERLAYRRRKLTHEWAEKLRRVWPDVSVQDMLFPPAVVPVVGSIKPDGRVSFYSGARAHKLVLASNATEKTKALEVNSDVPFAPSGNWIFLYEDVRHNLTDNIIHSAEPCLVSLDDGTAWYRRVTKGSVADRYTLLTKGHYSPIDNVSIAWVAECSTIKILRPIDPDDARRYTELTTGGPGEPIPAGPPEVAAAAEQKSSRVRPLGRPRTYGRSPR